MRELLRNVRKKKKKKIIKGPAVSLAITLIIAVSNVYYIYV